ncbi:MAG: hypothetical protein LBQ38_05920 [Spirochaetaceae bacterium]|jgi:hypothetical protein|nr:hypothetical protein [Spirochaetaceae bacterium]
MFRKPLFLVAGLLLAGALTAQELVIDYQYNVTGPDAGNYLTFQGPLRLHAVNKDSLDSVSGASRMKSTALLTGYQTDVMGKAALGGGLRSLLLYPVSPQNIRIEDKLTVSKAANGVITIQYVHRGVAYGIITDNTGKITLPRGNLFSRTVGYIQGAGPQVLHTDFSPDGTADKIDWAKVWNRSIPSGKNIGSTNNKTGDVLSDVDDPASLFYWSGTLQAAFDGRILKITGTLRPVKR